MFRPPLQVPQRRRRQLYDPYAIFLFIQLWQQVDRLPVKPPVTLALAAVNLAIFFLPMELPWVPSIRSGCLQPQAIFKGHQWRRLVWSAFLHADEMHVYYNMSSLLWKGVQLEQSYGSLRFAALVAELLLLSHGFVASGAALLASYIPEYRYLYYSTCAVGFSAVLFALKVVLNYRSADTSHVLGIQLPTKYLCWAELLLASFFNPSASFFGHLCGILAGFCHVLYIEPALTASIRWWRQASRAAHNRRQPRFAGSSRYAGGSTNPSEGAAAVAAAARTAAAQRRSQRAPQQSTRPPFQDPTPGGGGHAAQFGAGSAADGGHVSGSDPSAESREQPSLDELRQLRLQRLAASHRSSSSSTRRAAT